MAIHKEDIEREQFMECLDAGTVLSMKTNDIDIFLQMRVKTFKQLMSHTVVQIVGI